jgi:hypothetical protein
MGNETRQFGDGGSYTSSRERETSEKYEFTAP